MVATLLEHTNLNTGFEFYKKSANIDCKTIYGHIIFNKDNGSNSITIFPKNNTNSLNLISEEKKVLISLQSGPYHFFMNTFTSLLKIYSIDQNLLFILDKRNLNTNDTTFFIFLCNFLEDKKIKYKIINTNDYDNLLINNFYHLVNPTNAVFLANSLFEISKEYIKDTNILPSKKVYLSRSKIGDRSYNNGNIQSLENIQNVPFLHDNRIYNEKIIEDFFEQNGFEIVVPENFSSFEEQINYFYSVKTLVSVTSSGITNSIFMQNGGNVIEFITPLLIHFWDKINDDGTFNYTHLQSEQHHFYHAISYIKDHNYIGIPNKTRNPEDLINRMLNTPHLFEILKK